MPPHEHKKIYPLKDYFFGVIREAGYLHLQGIKNQSINQSINQSTNQSMNQSINQSINQSVNESINQSIDQSVNE